LREGTMDIKFATFQQFLTIGLLSFFVVLLGFVGPKFGRCEEKQETFKLAHIEPFKPFAVSVGGRSEGLAIEILTEAMTKAGLKVIFLGEPQDKIPGLLQQGQVDGIAFLAIDAKRRETYDFSDPYLISGGALYVKAPGLPSSDLRAFEGKTVATPKEGPLAGFIQKNFPKVNVLTDVKSYEETLQAVLNGKADAAALNTQAGAVLARELFPGRFSLPDKGFLETPIGVGVMKSKHGDFLKKLNEGMKTILTDGSYDRILAKWGVGVATKPRIP